MNTRSHRPASWSLATRLALVAAALLPLLSAGCVWQTARFTQTTNASAPHAAGSGLKVTTRNGHIEVRRGGTSDGQVAISATLRMVTQERLGQATIQANRNASGVLEVTALPPADGWRGSEGCSFEITVPEASGVELTTGNGHIEIEGLAGRAVLDTSNGAIRVLGHDGDVAAETSNGRIEATGVSGSVQARTSNGRVQVALGAGSSGPVQVRTSNGSVALDLSDAFRGSLDIGTSNGSIRVPDEPPAGVNRYSRTVSRRSASLAVGDGGRESKVRTSNGSVTVRFVR